MSEAYLGEIRIFAGNYAPVNWAFCNGQLLPVAANEALFSLLGTMYGGDGRTTFGVPNMQGRLPVGCSTSVTTTITSVYPQGSTGGVTGVTLTEAQIPPHTHTVNAVSGEGTTVTPGPTVYFAAAPAGVTNYVVASTQIIPTLAPQAIGSAGGNQPHLNVMPTLVLNYIISLVGTYPTRA